jgi:hypothetical protein
MQVPPGAHRTLPPMPRATSFCSPCKRPFCCLSTRLVRFVVLDETSVRIHLETRLLPVGFDNNLVIPVPIRVVQRFRHYDFVMTRQFRDAPAFHRRTARADQDFSTVYSTVARNFACKRAQFCATRCKCPNAELLNVSNAVQHSENVRNSLGLN